MTDTVKLSHFAIRCLAAAVNYLAHAYRHLDRPYFVAGTALPDWMNVVDRKNRARRQRAEPIASHPDEAISEFAQGVIQHHHDDQWFHMGESFVQLSSQFAMDLRRVLGSELGHQSAFLGHISVELLLDAELIARDPQLLDRYYSVMSGLDPHTLQQAASLICPQPVTELVALVPRFIDERFLDDYAADESLWRRLNGVMRRVRLPPLPEAVIDWLASIRPVVRSHATSLLTPPDCLSPSGSQNGVRS